MSRPSYRAPALQLLHDVTFERSPELPPPAMPDKEELSRLSQNDSLSILNEQDNEKKKASNIGHSSPKLNPHSSSPCDIFDTTLSRTAARSGSETASDSPPNPWHFVLDYRPLSHFPERYFCDVHGALMLKHSHTRRLACPHIGICASWFPVILCRRVAILWHFRIILDLLQGSIWGTIKQSKTWNLFRSEALLPAVACLAQLFK